MAPFLRLYFSGKTFIKEASLPTISTTVLAVVITYPISLKLGGFILGPLGDSAAMIWMVWWLLYAKGQNLPWQTSPILNSPFGVQLDTIPWQYTTLAYTARLASVVGEIPAYNLILLASFVLSGLTAYFLICYVTGNRVASLISSLIYAFAPYHIARSLAHLSLAATQWIPLYLLCLLRLLREPTMPKAILAGITFGIVLAENYYYGYFMAILTPILFVAYLFLLRPRLGIREIRVYTVASFAAILAAAPSIYSVLASSLAQDSALSAIPGTTRSYADLYTYSARWYSFLLPSVFHPLFGDWARDFQISQGNGNFVEQSNYLGYTSIALAIVGTWFYFKRPRSGTNEKPNNPNRLVSNTIFETNAVGLWSLPLFGLLALVSIWLSIGPTLDIGATAIPMPSHFLYQLFPMFRAYTRLGIVVMLAVSVIAAAGITFTLSKIKTPKRKSLFLIIVAGAVVFELASTPGKLISRVDNPPEVYSWLARQPDDFIIAEYPLVSNGDISNSQYLFWQRIHKKRLFNGALPDTKGDQYRESMEDITNPQTVSALAYFGVKYVIIHPDWYKLYSQSYYWANAPLNLDALPPGLMLTASFGDTLVYKVSSPPDRPIIAYGQGFYSGESDKEGQVSHLMRNDGNLLVVNPFQDRLIELEVALETWSFHHPRNLMIYNNGQYITEFQVPVWRAATFGFRVLLLPGENYLVLHNPDGAQEIDQTEHNGDKRWVSVVIQNLKLQPVSPQIP